MNDIPFNPKGALAQKSNGKPSKRGKNRSAAPVIKRDDKGRITPGEVLNPTGRPKRRNTVSFHIRAMAEANGEEKAKALSALIWKRALAGDPTYGHMVLDRLEGKAVATHFHGAIEDDPNWEFE